MKSKSKIETAETLLKWVGAVVAVGGLIWGITSFLINADTQAKIQAQTQQLEARKPFLQRQLALYTEATQVAATLATSDDPQGLNVARRRFWELYWGELAMVENGGLDADGGGVEGAMVKFGDCLKRNCSQGELQKLALRLAHTCRDSLAESWGVPDWKTPPH